MRIQEIKRYRLELSGEEMQALRGMLQYYEDKMSEEVADEDEIDVEVRRSLGIQSEEHKSVNGRAKEDGTSESLPEKALRIAGQARAGRRKSILATE